MHTQYMMFPLTLFLQVGDFAGNVTLLIESQEEGFVGAILVKEGTMPVGTPVGLFVENSKNLPSASTYQCPTTNAYDEKQVGVQGSVS